LIEYNNLIKLCILLLFGSEINLYSENKKHESMEDYLETIVILQCKQEDGKVRSVDIVNYIGFTPPSVSVAMKKARENNFIEIDSDGFITLTGRGYEIAQKTYERHAFFTNWLIKLGVDEQTAREDACGIEHVISANSFEAIKNAVMNKLN